MYVSKLKIFVGHAVSVFVSENSADTDYKNTRNEINARS